MRAFAVGDKVQMKHHGSQADDYQQAVKTGRIIRIVHHKGSVIANVSWSIGPVTTDEYIEDLIILNG